MNTVSSEQNSGDYQRGLSNGISILERLGIIDFNGHFSARLDGGNILINSGSSVRSAVGTDGETDRSALQPPKELPLHVAVYRARPDVRAVAHEHPKWSTLLSSGGLDYQVTMAQVALLGDVPRFPSPRSINNPAVAGEVEGCRKGLWKQGLFEKGWNYYLAKFGLTA